MAKLKSYIKRYGIIIIVVAFALLINSSINPYIVGDSFDSKKTNKIYRIKTAEVYSEKLKEISGIAYSDENKLFWVHNDSGNSSDIYALGEDGDIKQVVELNNIKNIDFEDISLRRYEDKNTLYIADVGNNDLNRSEMYIYRFEEPLYIEGTSNKSKEKNIINLEPDVLTLNVADLGINFEAMMVENETGKIFLVEKVKSKKARVYIVSKFDVDENNVFPSYYGEIDFEMYGKQEVVALDISKDDKYILIKTKSCVFMLDRKDFRKNVTSDMLKQMPYVQEYQGEAISWSEQSLGYYTVSESKSKKPLYIYYYRNVYK